MNSDRRIVFYFRENIPITEMFYGGGGDGSGGGGGDGGSLRSCWKLWRGAWWGLEMGREGWRVIGGGAGPCSIM